ncbi:tunicamycin resistance protein [Exiguobacterium sp. AB2]|uniref:tunicamycin resistance protein n=1 Tax=Exiguobacterium sp. AB2 TaxID=1484479 RepID=UPI0004A8ED83|nr:tunicamycin resistance protein [Exiguobacterium sp. AB2]KDN57757.1 Tunicamycin resistance protein [Exiguobacterium sp. AB2]
MIIWINGAFGSSKTIAAKQLQQRLANAFLYDPEQAGFFIRDNLPKVMRLPDFQQYPEWRAFNVEMVVKIATSYDVVILVPMTLVEPTYADDITGSLERDGFPVHHFILSASKRTLEHRPNKQSMWFNSWRKQQIDRSLDAFVDDINGKTIHMDKLSYDAVVDAIL